MPVVDRFCNLSGCPKKFLCVRYKPVLLSTDSRLAGHRALNCRHFWDVNSKYGSLPHTDEHTEGRRMEFTPSRAGGPDISGFRQITVPGRGEPIIYPPHEATILAYESSLSRHAQQLEANNSMVDRIMQDRLGRTADEFNYVQGPTVTVNASPPENGTASAYSYHYVPQPDNDSS
jgi:hypothetical protein